MMFNPIYHLSSVIIRIVVKKVNLPLIFTSIAINLFTVSRQLVRNHGFIPTLRVLFDVNRQIRLNGSLNSILLNSRLNPSIATIIHNTLTSNWRDCLSFSSIINKNFKWYILGLVVTCFNSISFYIAKFLFGLVLSSIGILFSESLSAISYLKDFSDYILTFVENHSNFKFYPEKGVSIKEDHLNAYAIFGIVILGLTGITVSLVLSDYYFHDFISKFPAVNTYIEFINNQSNNFSSWVSSFLKSPPSIDPIVRTPSISSDIQLPSNIPSPTLPPYDEFAESVPVPGINPW
uniref:Uncharacterized protein n=1 Tax=Ganoderma tsugae TaxID=2075311 RepID=A0A2S1WBA2_GANTS|nr:hypothetical protein [Ganoderma tsugae]AWJ63863.1 hypothetical protein [Ganoderma tsugae]